MNVHEQATPLAHWLHASRIRFRVARCSSAIAKPGPVKLGMCVALTSDAHVNVTRCRIDTDRHASLACTFAYGSNRRLMPLNGPIR